jgi:hypothetical protein
MKTVLSAAFIILALGSSLAQTVVNLNNNIITCVRSPVYGPEPSNPTLSKTGNTPSGTPPGSQSYGGAMLSGTGYRAQLFYGLGYQPESGLVEAQPSTTFRTGGAAGYLVGSPVVLPFPVTVGSPVTLQVRAWDNSGGLYPDWNAARQAWTVGLAFAGKSPLLYIGSLAASNNLCGLLSFNLFTFSNQAPVAVVTADRTKVAVGVPVCFDGSQSFDPEGRPLAYTWSFGDSAWLYGTNRACHSYDSAGSYEVSLSVMNDVGASGFDHVTVHACPPPTIVTEPATSITGDSAMLSASVNPNGVTTLSWFEWGATTNYGYSTSVTNLGGGTSPTRITMLIGGLTEGLTYHYRVVASNQIGLASSGDLLCLVPSPRVMAEAATDVTAYSANLHGTVYPNGWRVTAWFSWKDANGSGADEVNGTTFHICERTNSVPLRQPVTGLVPGRSYSYDLWVTNESFYAHDTQVFTTPLPATVITVSGSALTSSSAALTGSANPRSLPSRAWFEWGTTTNYGNRTPSLDVGSGSTNVPVNTEISQLFGLGDYHFRLVVSNAAGVVYGGDNELSTPPGAEVADGIYVTPTFFQTNRSARVTATACGTMRFYSGSTPPPYRIRLTRNGVPIAAQMDPVSVSQKKLVLIFPPRDAGFYGFQIQASNEVTHAWEEVYESGPRFFQVGEDAVAYVYHPFPRFNWTVPTNPKQFIGTAPCPVTGVITGVVTVPQQVHPRMPSDWRQYENCGYLSLGWTKDFRFDGEGEAGVRLTFGFPMDGEVTFKYEIPFQMILDFPTNVYAGQKLQLKARNFQFHAGTLTAQHNLSFSTYHSLWLNAPYDAGFPALVNEHSFEPDRLVVSGRLPVAPFTDSEYGPIDSSAPGWCDMPFAYLFDDGKVTVSEIATKVRMPDWLEERLAYASVTLGGQTAYTNSGASAGWSYGPHEVWTTGPHDGWQETPELWYAKADMIGLTYAESIPSYSQAVAPLFFLGVELGLNCGVNVRSRDVINLKPPYSYLTVSIPDSAIGSYKVVTNISLPIDATFVSSYLYNLWGGLYFDMPCIDRKDLDWDSDAFWRPEVTNNISVTAAFAVNKTVSVTSKAAWCSDFLLQAPFPPEADYDLISYPPAEAAEERRCLANLSFNGPPAPPMVPSAIFGTFGPKTESEIVLMSPFIDPAGDMLAGVPNGGILDITSAVVTSTATNITFKINLAGNPVTTDWGKYMVAIHSEAGGDTTGNAWLRPIGMDVGMNYWLGSWVDSGNGVTAWHYTNHSWSAVGGSVPNGGNPQVPELTIIKDTSSVTITSPLWLLGLSGGQTIQFDIYTSGAGSTDGAIDALANPAQTITNWSQYYNSGTNVATYTLSTIGMPLAFGGGNSILSATNGLFHAHLAGPFGATVVVESSLDMTSWTPLQTNRLLVTGLELTIPVGTNQQRFFRAHTIP